MQKVKTYDEYLIDDMVFEGRMTIELIEAMMEEESNMMLDEGWSVGSKGRNGDRTFRFTPGKNDTEETHTKIFDDDKNLRYHEVLLPKSGVMSYNLYDIKNLKVSQALKHPTRFKELENRKIDADSIDKFMKRTAMYIRHLLNSKPVDIITYPQSSSSFNKEMVEYILQRYKDSPGIKFIPNLLLKDITRVYINYDAAREIGLTNDEIYGLRKDIENWKENDKLYNLRLEIDALKDEIYFTKLNRKRGRPTLDFKKKEEELLNKEELAKIYRKGHRGKDATVGKDGRAKKFEIKSLDYRKRRAIEGLFVINPELRGIEQKLKGKNIVIFDDNISSGATLDDICLELQKYGVASILPITLAVIPKTVYGKSARAELKKKEKEEKTGKPEKIEIIDVKGIDDDNFEEVENGIKNGD